MSNANDLCYISVYKKVVLAEIRKERLLDAATITELGDILTQLPEQHTRISLVVDLTRVQAMSSMMLGKLVALHKAVLTNKGRVTLCGVCKNLMPLFVTTKLNKLFDMANDPQEVINLYQRKPI